jgi:hypothetical protein
MAESTEKKSKKSSSKKSTSRQPKKVPVRKKGKTALQDKKLAEGAQDLGLAGEFAEESREAAAQGASQVTSGLDSMAAAGRTADLGGLVAESGMRDIAQGEAALFAAEDIALLSEAVRTASMEDTADAMELAAMSGQLAVVGDVVYGLQMRSLGVFLAAMSNRLKSHAARELVQARSRQELAEAMGSVGDLVAGLGTTEAS